MVGTPYYMAPEMWDKQFSGPFSDLWSLGVIAYKLMVGRLPFNGFSRSEVKEKILNVKYEWPEDMEIEDDAKDLVA